MLFDTNAWYPVWEKLEDVHTRNSLIGICLWQLRFLICFLHVLLSFYLLSPFYFSNLILNYTLINVLFPCNRWLHESLLLHELGSVPPSTRQIHANRHTGQFVYTHNLRLCDTEGQSCGTVWVEWPHTVSVLTSTKPSLTFGYGAYPPKVINSLSIFYIILVSGYLILVYLSVTQNTFQAGPSICLSTLRVQFGRQKSYIHKDINHSWVSVINFFWLKELPVKQHIFNVQLSIIAYSLNDRKPSKLCNRKIAVME